MKRTFKLHAFKTISMSVSLGAIAVLASACATTDEDGTEVANTLAELEASQEQLGEIEAAAPGCMSVLATCFADGSEDCLEAFRECLPKPPKAEGLKEAAMACKAQAEELGAPPMSMPEDDEAAQKPGQGDKPAKPEMDGDKPAKPEMDGDKPAKPEGALDCHAVKKALHKGKKHAGHMKKAVKPCIEELKACVEVDDVAACAAAAQECVKENVAAAFEAHCEKALTKCAEAEADTDGDLSAEKCEKIAARCEEGPKPPVAPPVSESAE